MAARQQRNLPQSQDDSSCHEEIWPAGRDSPPQDVGSGWVSSCTNTRIFSTATFRAEAPNRKWVTDIPYIQTKQGVLYLSMIRDLYDNSIVAYKTGTEQSVNLVLDTIRQAIRREKKKVAAELQLHSDQGAQYASHAYFELTQQYGNYAFDVKTWEPV